MTMDSYAISLEDVQDAAKTIEGQAIVTPVMTSSTMDKMADGRQLFFKCENFQRVGAFKFRGALNAIKKLDRSFSTVITHSSGNHGQAIALAAQVAGLTAHVVMPSNSLPVKVAAVKGYGAVVTECGPTDRVEAAATIEGATPCSCQIGSYNHPHVMAGQGTVGLELMQQATGLDAVIVSVGGGGLISGIATAVKAINPAVKIIAAEPVTADDCFRSKQLGERILLKEVPDTIADGLRTSLGTLTWPIIRDKVDVVFTVSESDIIRSTRLVFERMKLVIEPSAGVAVAVALGHDFRAYADKHDLKRIGVILCGGNQDLDNMPW
eukprot:m.768881 g.768881  ORF g.768881 m.768881 type:complete len:323 (-) comp23232_c2_seq10:3258-4226(-)